MRAGNLSKLVSIGHSIEAIDAVGGVELVWTEYSKAWASITPLRGTEKWVSAEKHATATHAIRIRYIAGVTPSMRIEYNDRVFDILSAINVGERNKMIDIVAKEQL